MFDVIRYAMENEVSMEVIPLGVGSGLRIRLRDNKSAAQESLAILPGEMAEAASPDALIESRCDRILAMIGKRKAGHEAWAEESRKRAQIENFFRDAANG